MDIPVWVAICLMIICFAGGWMRGSESTRRYMAKTCKELLEKERRDRMEN